MSRSDQAASPSRLARLDRAVVPVLQRGARAVARGLGAPVRALARWEGRVAHGGLIRWVWPRRRVVMLVAVLLGLAGSAVHFDRYPELLDARREQIARDRQQTVRDPAGPSTGSAGLAGGSQAVGPFVGGSVETYLEQRHTALADADYGEVRVAVVSFDGYLSAQEVADLLPPELEPLFAQYRLPDVAARPVETEIVGGDLVDSMGRVLATERQTIVDEEAEVRRLLESGTVEDQAYVDDLERRLSELKTIRNVIDSGGGVVFAVIVEGPVRQLENLAADDRVRLVDLAPGETDPQESVFYGLRPEDRDTITYGQAA